MNERQLFGVKRRLEGIRSIIGACAIPIPESSISIPLNLEKNQIVDIYQQELNAKLDDQNGNIELYTPFGKWDKINYDTVLLKCSEFVQGLDTIVRNLDASRSILNIHLDTYSGFVKTVLKIDWLIDLNASYETRLGNGRVYYTPGEGWSFSQKLGVYYSHSHYLVRKKK